MDSKLDTPNSEALLDLYAAFVKLLGSYRRVDLKTGDINDVALPDCELTQHPPLLGAKKETVMHSGVLRKTFNSALPWVAMRRDNAHVALHPEGTAICIFHVLSVKLGCFPCCNLVRAPMIFLANVASDPSGVLKMSSMHEYAAKDPAEALKLLVEKCGWPEGTTFSKTEAFSVDS
ncbi:hypothetical protein T484DRAFT_1876345 [Baffinella frigidus]|nr:hypothetical protein T484DRAFT_1876345 [Cryptophyta sp. CCMP2293]